MARDGGRFGREVLDRIRDRIDIAVLIGETVKLVPAGRSHKGLCPFHQEKSPSFSVSSERGLFHCFGCKVSGDIFRFLELHEGTNFHEAVVRLAERAGVELEVSNPEEMVAEARERRAKQELYDANSIAASYFEAMLREHTHAELAREELSRRGLSLNDPAIEAVLREFSVGYAPHGWEGLALHLRSHGISPAVAERAGLLVARRSGSGYHDAFRHRLMVAIRDVQGRVVAFSGRRLPPVPGTPEPTDAQSEPPKYVNSRESLVYSKGQTLFGLHQARAAIRTVGQAVLVEGNFDLIAMHVRGLRHVVAPMGTAFTPEQGRMLRRFAGAVTLLFDADAAGKKATWAAREVCLECGLSARVAKLPAGKDPDEFLQIRGAQAMQSLLAAARSLDEVLIDDLCGSIGEGSDLSAKQRVLGQVRPILEAQEVVFRELLAKRVAMKLGLPPASVWRSVRGDAATVPSVDATYRQTSPLNETLVLSREVFATLLKCPELLDDPAIESTLGGLAGDWALGVAVLREEMRISRRNKKSLDAPALLAQLPQPIQKFAAETLCASTDIGGSPDTSELVGGSGSSTGGDVLPAVHDGRPDALILRRVLRENALKLEKAAASARYGDIQREIEQAEAGGDFARASALLAEKTRLVQLLRRSASPTDPSGVPSRVPGLPGTLPDDRVQ